MVALIVAQLFAKYDLAIQPSWGYYLGIVLMLVGIAVRQWSIAVLGRFFSGVIGVQEGQRVVESGPYRLVTHPSYSGALLPMVGIRLAFQSWGAALVIIPIFAVCCGYRMFLEERALVANLGNSYTEYMKRTKRVIPFLL